MPAIAEMPEKPKAKGFFCSTPLPLATREAVQAAFLAGKKPKTIAEEFGLKCATVRTWINRFGWKQSKRIVMQLTKRGAVNVKARNGEQSVSISDGLPAEVSENFTPGMAEAGAEVRAGLVEEIKGQLLALQAKPPRLGDLPTKRGIQGRTALVKTLAETAALVFPGWDSSNAGVLVFTDMRGTRDLVEIDAVRVLPERAESSAEPAPVEPAPAALVDQDSASQR